MSVRSVSPTAEIAWLVDLIGEAASLALVEARGGTRINVPATEDGSKKSFLVGIIGLEALRLLAGEYGGLYVTVPLARVWRIRLYLARGGMSQAEIATKTGATENYVQRLASADYEPMSSSHCGTRRGAKVDDGQMLLPI